MASDVMIKLDLSPFARVMQELASAFDRCIQSFGHAFKCAQRRSRRQAARSGTRGRRGVRSVAPWGMPWSMLSLPITLEQVGRLESVMVAEIDRMGVNE